MEEEKPKDLGSVANLHDKYFENLKTLFEEILVLKNEGGDNSESLYEKQKKGCMLFIMLKKINRLEKYRVREGRDAMHKERLRIDSKRLQLQNLLYEANHIKREIIRCYQFQSQDESIDLVDEDEFYASAPASISRPDITKDADHSKRLARLEWELNQRKELHALCKELKAKKQKSSEEISQKIKRLNSFLPCVKSLLKSTKSLQIALDMPVEQKWEVTRLVKLLSQPLYLYYIYLNAYIEVAEPSLSVTVLGNDDDVRGYENLNPADVMEERTGSDSDEMDTDPKTRKSYVCAEDVLKQQRGIILQAHPLAVSLIINYKNSNRTMRINAHYFPILGFVTVAATINLNKSVGLSGDIMSPDNLLRYLFDDDAGETSPVPNTSYQLKKIKMSETECLKYLNKNGYGKPYKWAQKMCGIELFGDYYTNLDQVRLENTIADITRRIKAIWNSRLSLIKEISTLESKTVDGKGNAKTIRVPNSCSLVLWTAISWENIVSNVTTARFVESELLKPSSLFYRAVIVRGSSKLECFISLSNCFPMVAPIWILSVSWNGQHTALNNPAIKDMEYWTNSHVIEDKRATLLTQLARTMSSFDIFLETEGQYYSPVEFPKEKPFVKPFSKRIRARPYKCVQHGLHILFKQ